MLQTIFNDIGLLNLLFIGGAIFFIIAGLMQESMKMEKESDLLDEEIISL